MWEEKKVSIVFSTYNEKNSIRRCIVNLFKTELVDEVISVNNNTPSGTEEEMRIIS